MQDMLNAFVGRERMYEKNKVRPSTMYLRNFGLKGRNECGDLHLNCI